MTQPDVACEYCRIPIPPREEGKEAICAPCYKLRKVIGGSRPDPAPPSKSNPMAASSYGLHEKYFPDG